MKEEDQEFLRKAGYVAGVQTVLICVLLPLVALLAVKAYMKI